jgi:hypothetical protein
LKANIVKDQSVVFSLKKKEINLTAENEKIKLGIRMEPEEAPKDKKIFSVLYLLREPCQRERH